MAIASGRHALQSPPTPLPVAIRPSDGLQQSWEHTRGLYSRPVASANNEALSYQKITISCPACGFAKSGMRFSLRDVASFLHSR
jgi:hypothetical protein